MKIIQLENKIFRDFENRYVMISEHSFVIFYTGWEKFWKDADKYRNNLVFPCLSQ